jgi:hypothetical protein
VIKNLKNYKNSYKNFFWRKTFCKTDLISNPASYSPAGQLTIAFRIVTLYRPTFEETLTASKVVVPDSHVARYCASACYESGLTVCLLMKYVSRAS